MTPPPSHTLSAIVIGSGRLPADPARPGVDGVRRGKQLHPRRDLARGADRDRRDVEDHRIDVDERPVADADLAVLVVERRAHHDALADVPEEPAQQRVALVPGTRRRAVELREQPLRTPELGRAVGVAPLVQLAPQHPLSHLAHP
jgi:hypothetical protein